MSQESDIKNSELTTNQSSPDTTGIQNQMTQFSGEFFNMMTSAFKQVGNDLKADVVEELKSRDPIETKSKNEILSQDEGGEGQKSASFKHLVVKSSNFNESSLTRVVITVLLLLGLTYGVYILLQDILAALMLGYFSSILVKSIKTTLQKKVEGVFTADGRSMIREAYVIRMFKIVSHCEWQDLFKTQYTLFNNAYLYVTVVVIFVCYKYLHPLAVFVLVGVVLVLDLVRRLVGYLFLWVFYFTNSKIRTPWKKKYYLSHNDFITMKAWIDPLLSYMLVLTLFIGSMAFISLLVLLFLMDMNQLRLNIASSLNPHYIINLTSISSVDKYLKEHLMQMINILITNTEINYPRDRLIQLHSNTSIQIMNDFTHYTNITSFTGLIHRVQYPNSTDIPASIGMAQLGHMEWSSLWRKVSTVIEAFFHMNISQTLHNNNYFLDNIQFLLKISVQLVLGLSNYAFYFVIYFTSMLYLVRHNKDPITYIENLVPVDPSEKFQQLLISPIKVAFIRCLFTYILLDACSLRYVFVYCLLIVIFTMIPLIPPVALALAFSCDYFYLNSNIQVSICLVVVYYYVCMRIESDVYGHALNEDPYFIGLGIVMGIYTFDIMGFLYGPLIVCLTQIIAQQVRDMGRSSKAGSGVVTRGKKAVGKKLTRAQSMQKAQKGKANVDNTLNSSFGDHLDKY